MTICLIRSQFCICIISLVFYFSYVCVMCVCVCTCFCMCGENACMCASIKASRWCRNSASTALPLSSLSQDLLIKLRAHSCGQSFWVLYLDTLLQKLELPVIHHAHQIFTWLPRDPDTCWAISLVPTDYFFRTDAEEWVAEVGEMKSKMYIT